MWNKETVKFKLFLWIAANFNGNRQASVSKKTLNEDYLAFQLETIL